MQQINRDMEQRGRPAEAEAHPTGREGLSQHGESVILCTCESRIDGFD